MTAVRLELKAAGAPQRAATAWRLHDASPEAWLRELSAWDVPHAAIRVAPLPASSTDRSPAAALATVVGGGEPSRPSPLCIPYGRFGRRLHLPVDGRLWPEVSEEEVDRLLIDHRTYVWDPAVGLIALDGDPWLKLAELIDAFAEAPGASPSPWDRAQAGVALASRLHRLAADLPPDAGNVVNQGREDIGSRKERDGELPQSPDEGAAGPLGAAGRQGRKLAAGVADALSNVAPGGWAERLGSWAARQREGVAKNLDAARNRELARLMHLLETDPDQGLKYALPLAGGAEHRGVAPAGGQLTPRDPSFDLGRLGRGGAADAWSVSYEYQLKLKAKYREAANRELQLGRHRRAAYILAELLGDYRAAAGALAGGGHHREAAALYKQKLNDRRQAASCLEQGGLWSEAIELYVEMKEHCRAGELYRKLGQGEAARRQFRSAVEKLQSCEQRDHLAIAAVLVARLDAAAEAMEELNLAWPSSPQAAAAQQRWLQLAAEHADDAKVRSHLSQLADLDSLPGHEVQTADVLLHAARSYPGGEVKSAAADLLLRVVSATLRETTPGVGEQLLDRVAQLAPDDRLLRRDCQRFGNRAARASANASPLRRRPGQPTLLSVQQLAGEVEWQQMCLCNNSLFVAGMADWSTAPIMLFRVPWASATCEVAANWPRISAVSRLLMSAGRDGDTAVALHNMDQPPLGLRELAWQSDADPVAAGGVPGISERTLALCRSQSGHTLTLDHNGDHLVLALSDLEGRHVSSQIVSLFEPEFRHWPQVGMVGSSVYATVGPRLLTSGVPEYDVGRPLRRLACGGSWHSQPRVALGLEEGGLLFVGDVGDDDPLRPFGEGLVDPEICINKGGYLVAAARNRTEVYDTRGELRMVAAMDTGSILRDAVPVAVAPAPRLNQFAILYSDGELRYYEVPC